MINSKYFNVKSSGSSDEWVRNTDWMDFPSVLVPTDETVYMLMAIFEDDFNRLVLRVDNTTALIDWGDGTTQVPSSFTQYEKIYDYSTTTGSVSVYKDGRNYKQVMVEVTGTNIFGFYSGINTGTINTSGAINSLDIYCSLPNSTNLRFSSVLYHPYVERVRIISTGTVSLFQCLNSTASLKVFEVPDWSVISSTYDMFASSGLETMGDMNIISSSDMRTMFNGSQIKEIGDITAIGISSNLGFSVFNGCQGLLKVGDIQNVSTNIQSFFLGCTSLREMGTWTVTSSTTIMNTMFNNCKMIDTIIFAGDMSGITSTTNAFNNCGNLRKLLMPGITVGFSISQCQLGQQELDDLFTSLGTASGSQTIIVTGNPGASTCDTSIATGKGWTVTT